jgi:hypothetical protein
VRKFSVLSLPTLNQNLAWLYHVAGPAGAFNDITTGTNRGFVCTANSSAAAFTARKGWDPVTGESLSLPAAAVASSNNHNRVRDAELAEAAQGGGVALNIDSNFVRRNDGHEIVYHRSHQCILMGMQTFQNEMTLCHYNIILICACPPRARALAADAMQARSCARTCMFPQQRAQRFKVELAAE